MAKTEKELKALKEEYKTLSNKLKELTEDELKEIKGGLEDMPATTIPGLEAIGPFAVGGIPLDSDSKLK